MGFQATSWLLSIWVWVDMEPPGVGPRILAHVSIYQGLRQFGVTLFLTHSLVVWIGLVELVLAGAKWEAAPLQAIPNQMPTRGKLSGRLFGMWPH